MWNRLLLLTGLLIEAGLCFMFYGTHKLTVILKYHNLKSGAAMSLRCRIPCCSSVEAGWQHKKGNSRRDLCSRIKEQHEDRYTLMFPQKMSPCLGSNPSLLASKLVALTTELHLRLQVGYWDQSPSLVRSFILIRKCDVCNGCRICCEALTNL